MKPAILTLFLLLSAQATSFWFSGNIHISSMTTAASAHYVSLAWDDTLNPPLTTYRVYRADASDCTGAPSFAPIVSGVVAKTYNDTHVASGVNYCYYVTAYNTVGESAPSGTSAAAIP